MKELEIEGTTITADDLREDIVIEASDAEKQSIIDNFPNKKNTCTVYEVRGNYLIVPRVIEE